MTSATAEPSPPDPAVLPDLGRLPGLDPRWSRRVTAEDADGVRRSWHVLDTAAGPDASGHPGAVHGTVVCVHGNPTWSYLWRRVLATAPPGWRVVAVDQLGMGWSERLEVPRTLAQRIDDLDRVLTALEVTGPVVTMAHDWGGPVSLGWAVAHQDRLAAVVLTNTGVHHPTDAPLPGLIRVARSPGLRTAVCVTTPLFVRTTTALSRPALPAAVRDALSSPYATAERRRSVGDFVADIPLEHDHPSRATLDALAEAVRTLDVPVLLQWGTRDPVFTERYLRDLLTRLPQADVHRWTRASHLVTEDVPEVAEHTWAWLATRVGPAALETPDPAPTDAPPPTADADGAPPWQGLLDRADDPVTAVVELGGDHGRISFAGLERRVRDLAAGLADAGMRAGDRVALLVPPGIDLTVALYACWRLGAVVVVADAGLGVAALGRALRGAGPDWVVGVPKALAVVVALRVPGRRIVVGSGPRDVLRLLRVEHALGRVELRGRQRALPEVAPADADAAVLFTSGATGPPKGVVYRTSQLRAQLAGVRRLCGLTGEDRMVAAFAPFALYGPALGVPAAVPDMDVTAPGTLTAGALAEAALAVEATVVFASPAALRHVVATAAALTPPQRAALGRVRLVLSFGAPVPVALLRRVAQLLPGAELHTPYGMTEALPVADISLAGIEAAGPGNGVCVGRPLAGVRVALSPLADDGSAERATTTEPEVTGEILVAAAHVKDRYDRLWVTERQSARTPGWHRTGDVGHLDTDGRLWVEGRLVHVVTTADGPRTPVGVEQRVEALDAVDAAAAVGVGPAGTQQLVLVVVPAGRRSRGVLADPDLAAAVRAAAGAPVAAVLTTESLPTDIRHASKVDRARLARWAGRVLAGHRPGRP